MINGGNMPRLDACNGTPIAAASVTTTEISNNVYCAAILRPARRIVITMRRYVTLVRKRTSSKKGQDAFPKRNRCQSSRRNVCSCKMTPKLSLKVVLDACSHEAGVPCHRGGTQERLTLLVRCTAKDSNDNPD